MVGGSVEEEQEEQEEEEGMTGRDLMLSCWSEEQEQEVSSLNMTLLTGLEGGRGSPQVQTHSHLRGSEPGPD